MFIEFFMLLKAHGVPATVTELMTLMQALDRGMARSSLDAFYNLARAILVKSEAHYDQYDQVFAHFFKDAELSQSIKDEVMRWLEDPIAFPQIELTPELVARLDAMDLEELRRELEQLLAEQTERHDGGNRWIGTGGRSAFGHSGHHPGGIRIGGGERGMGTAVQVAAARRFRNYRQDVQLDVRQLKVALSKLRALRREGAPEELDLDETVDQTCRNAGELELVWVPPRRNQLKVMLLMDAGGSMTPYAHLVSRLFSAAAAMKNFKEFEYYYFHNCVYADVYRDIYHDTRLSTGKLVSSHDGDWRVLMLGDARMAMSELTAPYGAINYYEANETPGVEWLRRLHDHFRRIVWLNPIPARFWNHPTTRLVGRFFPMYPLTIEGLEDSVRFLRR
jgi:uncharacterized protein with von Willebrand factor type A (vWA) domain